MNIESTYIDENKLSVNISMSALYFLEAMFCESSTLSLVSFFLTQFDIEAPEVIAEVLHKKYNDNIIDFLSLTNLTIQL